MGSLLKTVNQKESFVGIIVKLMLLDLHWLSLSLAIRVLWIVSPEVFPQDFNKGINIITRLLSHVGATFKFICCSVECDKEYTFIYHAQN